jgi:hypothetical protein
MEIRFIPDDYSVPLSDRGLSAVPAEFLENMFAEFTEQNEVAKFRELNYGPGADWIWIYAAIAGIAQLIILGEKINSGFEGWAKLAKRILNLKKKCRHIALDRSAISVLCVYKLLELRPDAEEIEMVIEFEREVPVGYGTAENGNESDFIEKAQAIYLQGFIINSEEFFLFCSNMEGEIILLKRTKVNNKIGVEDKRK